MNTEHCPRCGGAGHTPESCPWPIVPVFIQYISRCACEPGQCRKINAQHCANWTLRGAHQPTYERIP